MFYIVLYNKFRQRENIETVLITLRNLNENATLRSVTLILRRGKGEQAMLCVESADPVEVINHLFR